MMTIDEIKNCRYWQLIHSLVKKVENLNLNEEKKRNMFKILYDIEHINQHLLVSAEKAAEYIENGIEFGYIDPDQESETPEMLRGAINKAKGADE